MLLLKQDSYTKQPDRGSQSFTAIGIEGSLVASQWWQSPENN